VKKSEPKTFLKKKKPKKIIKNIKTTITIIIFVKSNEILKENQLIHSLTLKSKKKTASNCSKGEKKYIILQKQ
jgi:hypothetical protein